MIVAGGNVEALSRDGDLGGVPYVAGAAYSPTLDVPGRDEPAG
jgi:hypothetical protein